MHIEKIIKLSANYFNDTSLNNKKYAFETMTTAFQLIKLYKEWGISVDQDVVLFASGFHTIGYGNVTSDQREYAAKIATTVLDANGYGFLIESVQETITTSSINSFPASTEAKILFAANLRVLMQSYDKFKECSFLLYEEHIISTPDSCEDSFFSNYINELEKQIKRDKEIMPAFYEDPFHINAIQYVEEFKSEYLIK